MILALESSCDETALALFDPQAGLKGEWIHSQIALHEQHGGVVPELAAREHLRNIPDLLGRLLAPVRRDAAATSGEPEAGFQTERPGMKAIREGVATIAVTYGPGLAPCLALGVTAAKALAAAWDKPLVGVNHLRGHVWSPFMPVHAEAPVDFERRSADFFPHLALLVSGGHTLLARVDRDRTVRVLSSTRDDAAGEALDKGAKLLGLGYPGGPLIEARASSGAGDAFDFPRALNRKDELDFSFSGLKTSLRYTLERMGPEEAGRRIGDLCASYQEAVVDALAGKVRAALGAGSYRSVGLSGGVARNGSLRQRIAAEASRARAVFLPVAAEHAGDNAGMIAFAAWIDPEATDRSGWDLGIAPGVGL